MTEKVIGYLLLTLGLLIIAVSTLTIYQVFVNKKAPIQIFNFGGVSISASQLVGQNLPSAQNPKIEIISKDMLNGPLNLTAELFLMGFLVNVGFRIASLGTQLVRPIKVQNLEIGKKIINT
jgi:hypothetical protein